jgi:hypothetical protein
LASTGHPPAFGVPFHEATVHAGTITRFVHLAQNDLAPSAIFFGWLVVAVAFVTPGVGANVFALGLSSIVLIWLAAPRRAVSARLRH